MIKKIKNWLFTLNLTFLLTLNLFFVIAAVLALVALGGLMADRLGWVSWTEMITPGTVMEVLYAICILLGISEVVMIRLVILRPVQRMVTAMQRLAEGDFAVRMTCRGWMRPLELREFTRAFNTAAEELGGTELLRKDFINNFSHEFKTPITSLGGFADLLLEDEEMPPEERREYLQIISSESRRLANLANSVLALSRVEAQTILTDAAPFDLTEQLRQAVLLTERKWDAKGLDVRLEAEPCRYTGSEALLKEVWVNLLDNAIKFSPPGGQVLVTLRSRPEQGGAAVTVQDFGPGMDEQTQRHIFDRFYQGDTSHKTEGSGLGLAMARKVVELHRGEIAVQSAPGQGACFTVALP